MTIPLQPIDIVVGGAALYAVVGRLHKPGIFKYFNSFLFVALFSFILSVFIFKDQSVIYGLFYLLRLGAYFYFFIYVWNFVKKSLKNKRLLQDSLLGVSVASALFGWIQFFMIPDIKAFFVYGWDMHLFRLVGTFLDPTFLGLIIIFGLLASLIRLIVTKGKIYVPIILFLLISLAFTYSRASYLAFLVGALIIGILERKLKYIIYLIAGLITLIILLPTSRNHSIEFLRTFSAIARVDNYSQTLEIAKKFPVLGVGFDNLCLAKNKYVSIEALSSHSCSGSDSSLLFVLATTGAVGFIIFLNLLTKIAGSLGKSVEAKAFIASAAALLVHSVFSNSMFYPWIIGYLLILLAMAIRE